MKRTASYIPIFAAMLGISFTVQAATIFQDLFESADMSASNADGFTWDANNSTSIVTQDAVDGPVAVWNNGPIYNIHPPLMPDSSIRDWTAYDGAYSLRVRYAAGVNWAEQRFDMGGAYPEVWIAYWIRVPGNYSRGSGSNNKWFDILMATMADYTTTTVSRVEMQDWQGAAGSMNINIQFRNGTDGLFTNSSTYNNFVTPADAGRWMRVVYYLKASSTPAATDGIIRMYRIWAGETSYTLINDLSNINVGIGAGSIAAGRPGWSAGYLMGYANSTYANDTEWLIDSFIVSDTPLITTPMPPTNFIVN